MNKKTFYYCYYLLSKGGNMDEAQSLLKQDLEKFVKRQRMFANIKQYNDTVITNGGTKIFRKEDLAKTADLLLQFKGIKNTFVIGKISETEYGISARTTGKMNINSMMEKMGGGGNEHEAATIIKDKTFEQIEKKLLKLIK
jgi:c-di-AMP phosphodiesterase-like protein